MTLHWMTTGDRSVLMASPRVRGRMGRESLKIPASCKTKRLQQRSRNCAWRSSNLISAVCHGKATRRFQEASGPGQACLAVTSRTTLAALAPSKHGFQGAGAGREGRESAHIAQRINSTWSSHRSLHLSCFSGQVQHCNLR